MERVRVIRTWSCSIALIFTLSTLLLACSPKSDVRVLKLGHGLDVNHPVHKAMVFMADRIKEKSGGKLLVEIYPGEQLGSEREMVELVQFGNLDMVKSSTSPMESFVPVMGVCSVPFLFRNDEHCWNVLVGPIGKEILNSGLSVGLRGLCFYDAGARSFYTKDKAIQTPDDLTGMKIRVQESKTSMSMVEALGAAPTPVSWGELYTCLQQGVVDGAENNPPSFYTSRHYEVCKYYSLDEHTRVPDILLIGESVWQSLSEEEQKIVQEAADESSDYERELWKSETQAALEAIQKDGVEIIHPDVDRFRAKVAEMLNSYTGTEIGDFIDRIKEVR